MASGGETSRRSLPASVVLKRTGTSLQFCAPDGPWGEQFEGAQDEMCIRVWVSTPGGEPARRAGRSCRGEALPSRPAAAWGAIGVRCGAGARRRKDLENPVQRLGHGLDDVVVRPVRGVGRG